MALVHAVPNKVEAAYRRGDLFEKRRRLAEDWAVSVITAAIWLIRTFWPVLAIGTAGFVTLGVIGIFIEPKPGSNIRTGKPVEPPAAPLPPISRIWTERKKREG